MTKTSLIQIQTYSDLKSIIIMTHGFFNLQKQNESQGSGSYVSYLEESSNLHQSDSENEWEYMRVSMSPISHPYLDYSKYKFDLKDIKFKRDEINER